MLTELPPSLLPRVGHHRNQATCLSFPLTCGPVWCTEVPLSSKAFSYSARMTSFGPGRVICCCLDPQQMPR